MWQTCIGKYSATQQLMCENYTQISINCFIPRTNLFSVLWYCNVGWI